jgi:hypothetical protein
MVINHDVRLIVVILEITCDYILIYFRGKF